MTQTLLLSTNTPQESQTITTESIAKTIKNHSSQLEVKRINYGEKKMDLNFLVKVSSLESLNNIQDGLKKLDQSMSITFIDNTI
jgi:hypothetical protein